AGSAGGGDASGVGGACGIRGGCNQPPGTRSALAATLTGSAATVARTIAVIKIGTFRISLPLLSCTHSELAAYDNPGGSCIGASPFGCRSRHRPLKPDAFCDTDQ